MKFGTCLASWMLFVCMSMSSNTFAQISIDFTASVLESCGSLQTTFQPQVSSTSGTITQYNWDLDGSLSNLMSPGKIYPNPGFYTICLEVTDASGNTASLCKEDYIKVYRNPSPEFDISPVSGCAPLEVSFIDNTTIYDGAIVEWIWDLGGTSGVVQATDANQSIITVYESAGFYSSSLTVIDEYGCINSISKNNVVEVVKEPQISISTTEPIGCNFPLIVDFVNLNIEANTIYTWDFGNGETFVGNDPGPVTYDVQGDYDITVTANNSVNGCSQSKIFDAYVSPGGGLDFDFEPKILCSGGDVYFEDLTYGQSDSIIWDFGDGTISNEKFPRHYYGSIGEYEITMTRYSNGCIGSTTSVEKVIVRDKPEAVINIDNAISCNLPHNVVLEGSSDQASSFEWTYIINGNASRINEAVGLLELKDYGTVPVALVVTDQFGCKSLPVLDTILSYEFNLNMPPGIRGCAPMDVSIPNIEQDFHPISEWNWSVGTTPIQTSQLSNPNFTFPDTGVYSLELVVVNEIGCVDTLVNDRYFQTGMRPVSGFDAFPLEVCTQEEVQFNDLSTGLVNEWKWILNDSSEYNEQNPNLTFSSPGKIDVELIVGHNGCLSYLGKEDYINVIGPDISVEETYNCDNPYEVNFLEVLLEEHYDTDWEIKHLDDVLYSTDSPSFNYEFQDTGQYSVILNAFDEITGCYNFDSIPLYITDPKARFTVDRTTGCTPHTTRLYDQSEFAIEWNYYSDEGIISNNTDPNPTYVLYTPGVFNKLFLEITDIHGCKDIAQMPDSIMVNELYPDFLNPDPVCSKDSLHLFDNSSAHFGEINTWEWDIEYGLFISQSKNPSMILDSSGTFDIKLVVEGEYGCRDSIEKRKILEVLEPAIVYSVDSLGCTWAPMLFENQAHRSGVSYLWDFGDGNISSEVNPHHQYEKEGKYTVCLSAVDEMGCYNEVCLDDYIRIADPVANFTADNVFGDCPPLIVEFENLSRVAKQYIWDFGDNSGLSNLETPTHVYTEPGVFDVKLIAELTPACADSLVIEDYVLLQGPVGQFEIQSEEICAPVSVMFNASSNDLYTYIWDYGNGVLDSIPGLIDVNENYYQYENGGSFTPNLILIDENNCKRSFSGEEIIVEDIKLEFYASDTIQCGAPAIIDLESIIETTSDIEMIQWTFDGAETNFSSDLNPTIEYGKTGIFDIELFARNASCEDTLIKEAYIKVVEFPAIDLNDNFNLCFGESNEITINPEEDSYSYEWGTSEEGLNDYGSQNPIVSTSDSKMFFVNVSNEYGCSIKDSIWVEVIRDNTDLLPKHRNICEAQPIQLNVDYGSDPMWLSGENLSCLDCPDPQANPTQSGTYVVQVYNDFGCKVLDSMSIRILTPENINAGSDKVICVDDNVQLIGSGVGTPVWEPQNLIQNQGSFSAIASPQESQWIYLNLVNDNGNCVLMDSLWVEVKDEARISVEGDSICPGNDGLLLANGDALKYKWYDGDELIHTGTELIVNNPVKTITYQVIGELGSCPEDSAYVDLTVLPKIEVSVPDEVRYIEDKEIGIELNSSGGHDYSYEWNPADLVDCSECQDIRVTISRDTFLTVMVMDEFGCEMMDTVKLRKLEKCPGLLDGIFIPNVFSPNEDGVNDIFKIESPLVDKVEHFRVFDRWGEKIFDGDGTEQGWDGRLNGKKLSPGVYVYVIDVLCEFTGELISVWGDVTLLR